MNNAPATTQPAPDTFGHENIRHPFSEYTLAQAVALARNIARITCESVNSLAGARKIVDRSRRNCGHNWIAGTVAMDLFDAAIDGFDIRIGTRMLGSDTKPKDRNVALKQFAAEVDALERSAVNKKMMSGLYPPTLVATYTPAMFTDCFDQGLSPEDAHRKLTSDVAQANKVEGRKVRARKL